MIEKTPLDEWIRKRIAPKMPVLTRERLTTYQLEKIIENVSCVKKHSIFYRDFLSGVHTCDIKSYKDICRIPFTTSKDIKKYNLQMSCVSQNEISRIVTLDTSGTTGLPKRIYFTEEDQELTTDFFQVGMSTFTKPGQKVLILMPGARPGSIGDLLQKALNRMNVSSVVYGIVDDPEIVERIIIDEKVNGIVGIPQQIFALSMSKKAPDIKAMHRLENVLLSTDYVSNSVVKRIEKNWGCNVYEHYGMTETGLGGGVFCKARKGYHLREADMLFEIIDPESGAVVKDGEFGEVVFTTLTRKGMPLIRYRTGDISRFINNSCECGTVLRSMDKIQYRINSSVKLTDEYILTMSKLEEILFSIEGVLDFDAILTLKYNKNHLMLYVNMISFTRETKEKIIKNLRTSELGCLISKGELIISIEEMLNKEMDIKAIKKRKITDKRGGKS